MSSSFWVAKDDPWNIDIFEMLSGEFSSVGSKAELWAILGSNFDMLILFSEHDCDQVKVYWSNYHV